MKLKLLSALALIAFLFASHAFGYQVQINTTAMPHNAAPLLDTWITTAVRGGSCGAATTVCRPTPGTPCENETSPTVADFRLVFSAIPTATSAHIDGNRVYVSDWNVTNAAAVYAGITNFVESQFLQATQYGYGIGCIALNDYMQGTHPLNWSLNEVQQLRDYLDLTGRTNVLLSFDARSNMGSVRNMCASPLIDEIMLEAQPHKWYQNVGSRQELLKWLWSNPVTAVKQFSFLMPPESEPGCYSQTNDFMSVRRFLVWLGGTFMDYNFLRSSNVTFIPVTYNGPTMTFYPDKAAPNLYTNTMSSIWLSLMEQRDIFEGRSKIPTIADADSFVRTVQVNLNSVADVWTLTNTPTAPINITVGNGSSPASNLTMNAVSLNPVVVPQGSFSFGGSGSNRTMVITPAANQTGSAQIVLTVSDGTNSASTTFYATVGTIPGFRAVANGALNSNPTWGRAAPVSGNTNGWGTAGFSLSLSGQTDTFNGKTLIVDAGGTLNPGQPNSTLTLNNLILDGGTILINNNVGTTLDFNSTNTFTLNSGTIKSGATANGRNVFFQNGRLAGTGIININSLDASGNYVQFRSTMNMTNFTGVFKVSNNGLLVLPAISKPTFGLILSGSGQYDNSANVALASLVMGSSNIPPGVYYYTNFTPVQQGFLVNTNSKITVTAPANNQPPVLTPIGNQTVDDMTPLEFFATAADSNAPPQTLTYSLGAGKPAGAAIDPLTGEFTWTPTQAQGPSTNTVTVRVSDGVTNDFETFQIVVNEVNFVPVLAPIPTQYATVSNLLDFTVTQADPNVNLNTLAYSLAPGAPAGAAIDPDTGEFTWMPTVAQGPSTNTVTIQVSNDFGSDTNTFQIVVTGLNADSDGDGTLDAAELNLGRDIFDPADLGFEFNADGNFDGWGSPANLSNFAVTNGSISGVSATDPHFARSSFGFAGGSVSNIVVKLRTSAASTVLVYWTRVGATTYTTGKSASFNYTNVNNWQACIVAAYTNAEWSGQTITGLRIDPTTVSGQSFAIDWVRGLNGSMTAPTISAIANQAVPKNTATDPLPFTIGSGWTPASSLEVTAYSSNTNLVSAAGVALDGNGANRTVTLTPASNQVGATTMQLVVSDGVLSATNSFVLTVLSATNSAPTLAAITNRTLIAGQTLTFTNTAQDGDYPPQSLTFGLLNAPTGAAVNASNGLFIWRPAIAQSPSTNLLSVKVTDNGVPSLSATQSFSVMVGKPAKPLFAAGGVTNRNFSFNLTGDTGPDYYVYVSTNLTGWTPIWTNSSATPPFQFTDTTSTNFNRRFYRVLLGP